MSKNSTEAYQASRKTNLLTFDPDVLVIVSDPKHPLYDPSFEDEISESFVANIDHYGVIEPVVVRKNPETGDIEVVAGRTRVRAARIVNKNRKKRGEPALMVPGIPKKGEDVSLMGVMVSENEARKDKSPLHKARVMQRMVERGVSAQDLATTFNCSIGTVKNLLGLLGATAAVKKAVDRGEVSAAVGYKLARMEPEEQRAKLGELKAAVPMGDKGPKGKGGRPEGSGKKAMAIVTGNSEMRSRGVVSQMAQRISVSKMAGHDKDIADKILMWILGEDTIEAIFEEGYGQR